MRVSDLGEQALLRRLQAFCPPQVVGDDAAVLSIPEGQQLVVTTDTLIDGVHFALGLTSDLVTMDARDVGWRAMAANLSDLAAMGASPIGVTVGLGLPIDLEVDAVDDLYRGLTDCLLPQGGVILGGDMHRSPVVSLCITALGQVHPTQVIRRSGACIGDAIVATGCHGRSRVGLELLLNPELRAIAKDEAQPYIQAHRRPIPRLDVVPLLHTLQVTAGMDSSDGLADAVLQLCRSSGVGAQIHEEAISQPDLSWLSAEQSLEWSLYGGEDFELVVCLPPAKATQLVQQLDGAAVIGTITTDTGVHLLNKLGQHRQKLHLDRGFQHFS
ncbi:MAG: thiamine-phosphate kinase [Elainellaceae cyanobacterium]